MAHSTTAAGRSEQITAATIAVIDRGGLDRTTIRSVAAEADVAIGTVQHYFPTKDALVAGAYEEVVRRIRARLTAVRLGADTGENLVRVLRELLPLDAPRATEVRVHLALAAQAATTPALAELQRAALTEMHDALVAVFARAWGDRAGAPAAEAARAALALADGLALHAVSSGRLTAPREQERALAFGVRALLA